MLLFFGIGHQSGFDVFQGGKDRFLVIKQRFLLEGVLEFDIPADAAAGKNRPGDAGAERPEFTVGASQQGDVVGGKTGIAGQKKSGEQVGGGHTDTGGGGMQLRFGPTDIRAAADQIGGQPHGNLRRGGGNGEGPGQGFFQGAGVLAQQHAQAVDGSPGGGLQDRDLGGGAVYLGVSVGHIQTADKAGLETLVGDPGGFFLGLQILPGNGQLLLEAPEAEVVVADVAHQGDQDIPAVFNRGLEVGAGGFKVAPGPAKNIQFPGSVQTYLK